MLLTSYALPSKGKKLGGGRPANWLDTVAFGHVRALPFPTGALASVTFTIAAC